jgi:predicted Rossmann-fold nucleotide-binding protein
VIVAVFGAAVLATGCPAEEFARRTGEAIARRGWITATGGYAGTMAAASRGAAEAGGHTIGITCETLTRAGRRKNEWVREEIVCATIDGGIGTLTEISFCWNQIQMQELPPRPLVLAGAVWRTVFPAFFRAAEVYLKESDVSLLALAGSPEEAVQMIASPRPAA